MVPQVIRYSDLKARGVIKNRATLSRWIKRYGFPPGFLIGLNSRAWYQHEVEDWLHERQCTEENGTPIESNFGKRVR